MKSAAALLSKKNFDETKSFLRRKIFEGLAQLSFRMNVLNQESVKLDRIGSTRLDLIGSVFSDPIRSDQTQIAYLVELMNRHLTKSTFSVQIR